MDEKHELLDESVVIPDEMAAAARKRTATQPDAELLDTILGIGEAL